MSKALGSSPQASSTGGGMNKRLWWSSVWSKWRCGEVELDGANHCMANSRGVAPFYRAGEAAEGRGYGRLAKWRLTQWYRYLKVKGEVGRHRLGGGNEEGGVAVWFGFIRVWKGVHWWRAERRPGQQWLRRLKVGDEPPGVLSWARVSHNSWAAAGPVSMETKIKRRGPQKGVGQNQELDKMGYRNPF
jgi:hypothetical protein